MRRKPRLLAASTSVLTAATMAAGVLVFAADAANAAARRSHHGQVIGQPTLQYAPSDLYESLSQGRQPYPNPDRELYVPQRGAD
jgi:hypothetical protein